MNILFCGDGNIAKGVIIATLSLAEHIKEELNIYILTATVEGKEERHSALSSDFAPFLESVLREKKENCSVKLFDISHLFNGDKPTANMETRFTPCCMLRLYADLVDEIPSRVLYLDNDIICREDISPLYYTEMGDSEVCGVLDFYGSHFFRRYLFHRDYLNSGVLLLDMDNIRKGGLFERCRERCRTKEMFMPDQSALNKLAHNKKYANRKYNEQRRLSKKTAIQHFTTSFRLFPYFHSVSVKPWDIERLHSVLKIHEYDELLEEYKAVLESYEAIKTH